MLAPSQEALFHEDSPPDELPQRAISRNCTARFHVVPSTLPFAFPAFPFSESFDFHLTDERGMSWEDEKVHKGKSSGQKDLKDGGGEREREQIDFLVDSQLLSWKKIDSSHYYFPKNNKNNQLII